MFGHGQREVADGMMYVSRLWSEFEDSFHSVGGNFGIGTIQTNIHLVNTRPRVNVIEGGMLQVYH